MNLILLAALVSTGAAAFADQPVAEGAKVPAEADKPGADAPSERFSIHFQATVATQAHPAFSARYSGRHSLKTDAESATSVVMDLAASLRLWRGAELVFQPELAGGSGLSSTLGVAAFPSGEVYRVGDPQPTIVPARLLLRQTLGLGGGTVPVEAGPGQLGGSRDRDALTFTVGKLSVPDQLDHNPVSSDPHSTFLCWGLFGSAAYDYPADTRGYTWGVTADLTVDWWSVRAGMFLLPRFANELELIWDITQSRGLAAEGEARFQIAGHKAAARLLGFLNSAPMGSYDRALAEAGAGVPDVVSTRAFGRTKAGLAGSVNAELGSGLSAFARLSFNDGQNETWAFTEVDRSAALGAVQSGSRWGREADEAGAALVVSGLSGPHRRYLQAGGLGFILGDGGLDYGSEIIGELYYRAAISKEVSIAGTWQPIINPAYNRDRGPVQVFTARAHVAF